MSVGSGGSMRTIWITLRAVNYASLVINDIQKDIGNLMKKEFMLSKTNEQLITSTKNYLSAGMMFATLSQQMAGSILNMAMNSRQGAGEMARLKQQIFLTTNALNNAAYEFLKSSGALALLNTILKELQRNKGLQQFVIIVLATVAVLAAVAAAIFLAGAALNGFWVVINGIGPVLSLVSKMAMACGVSFNAMALSIGMAIGSFMVFFMITQMFTGQSRAIVSGIMIIVGALILLAFALNLVTFGASGIGAAIGSAALMGSIGAIGAGAIGMGTSFASGTQSVQKTGPIFAHKGEVVYNPSTNRPLQVGNDMARGGGGNITNVNSQITIENVHTKADYDDVAYQINKANRMGARSVR